MTEVKDKPGRVGDFFQYAFGFAGHDLRCGGEGDGIEVSLEGSVLTDTLPDAPEVGRPVHTEDRGTGMEEVCAFVAHAFGVKDDGNPAIDFADDLANPTE